MKFIVALEVEAENLHEAYHIAEGIHDTVNYREDVRNDNERFTIAFVQESEIIASNL